MRALVTFVLVQIFCDVTYSADVCDGETFQGRCLAGEVILMKSAQYGRMRLGKCVEQAYGHLGCGADILPIADAKCSGKRTCDIVASRTNKDIVAPRECGKDLSLYLDINYQCVKVIGGHSARCNQQKSIPVTDRGGIISSSVTDTTGCGSITAPWAIYVSPGQIVTISLIDFDSGSASDDGRHVGSCERDDVYGYITDGQLGVNQTLCGGNIRERTVFISRSNIVIIQIIPSTVRNRKGNFLLSFQVSGCPDISPPTHAWYKRNGTSAVIGCEWSAHSWHLRCENNNWVGVVGNCSGGGEVLPASDDEGFTLSPVLSISLIVGLGVLVVFLLCALIIGCACLKGRGHRDQPKFPEDLTQQQPFMYQPCRPNPITQQTMNMQQAPAQNLQGTMQSSKPAQSEDLLHIYETPVPQFAIRHPDVSGNQMAFATLPCRGTMTGSGKDGLRPMSSVDGPTTVDPSWSGTK